MREEECKPDQTINASGFSDQIDPESVTYSEYLDAQIQQLLQRWLIKKEKKEKRTTQKEEQSAHYASCIIAVWFEQFVEEGKLSLFQDSTALISPYFILFFSSLKSVDSSGNVDLNTVGSFP